MQWTGQDCCDQVGACEEGIEVQLIPVLKSRHSVGGECFYLRTWNTLDRLKNKIQLDAAYYFIMLMLIK